MRSPSPHRTAALAAVLLSSVAGVAHAAGFGQLGSPIGEYGTSEDTFSNVTGLDVQDGTGDLFVGDTRPIQDGDEIEYRIHQFHDGAFVRNLGVDASVNGLFSGGARYARLAADPRAGQATLYQTRPVEGATGDKVLRFDTTTGAKGADFAPTLIGQGAGKLDDPIAVAVDPDSGDVIVGGTTTGDDVVVRRYTAAGALAGSYNITSTGSNNLRDVAAGPGGVVYVAQYKAGSGGDDADAVIVERFAQTGQAATDTLNAPPTTTDVDVTPAGALVVGTGTPGADGTFLKSYTYDAGAAAGSRFAPQRSWARRGSGACELSQGAVLLAAGASGQVAALDLDANVAPQVARVLRFGDGGTGCGFDPVGPSGAGFTVSPATPNKGAEVTFSATATDDGPLTDASYTWSFGDGGVATGQVVKHVFAANGAREVTLTVTDADGLKATVKKTVTVASVAPVASFTTSATSVAAGGSVAFDGNGSSDPDGHVVKWEWDFDGDGGFDAAGATASHVYGAAGTFTARLRVTDDDGRTASASRTIVVSAPNDGGGNPGPGPGPGPTPPGGGGGGGVGGTGDVRKPLAATIKGGTLTADAKGYVTVTVTCPSGAASACSGKLTLKVKSTTYGTATYKAAVGRSVKVKVKLSTKARKALKKSRSIKIALTAAGAGGTKGSATATLKAAKRGKR